MLDYFIFATLFGLICVEFAAGMMLVTTGVMVVVRVVVRKARYGKQ